jgi:hypothetical protein
MTHNQIRFFLLKFLNLSISLSDLTLKASNFIFMLFFEFFPFLLLFFDEKVMGTSLFLELNHFLAKF